MAVKGPDEDSSGGVAFRHWRGATFRDLLKLWEFIQLSRLSRLGLRQSNRQGGWRGRLNTMADNMTDESPTLSGSQRRLQRTAKR